MSVNRYKVTGEMANGQRVVRCFQAKNNASKLAAELYDSAIFDMISKEYVGGNSDFVKRLMESRNEPTTQPA